MSVLKYVSLNLFKDSILFISIPCLSAINFASIAFLFLAKSEEIAASFPIAPYSSSKLCWDEFNLF